MEIGEIGQWLFFLIPYLLLIGACVGVLRWAFASPRPGSVIPRMETSPTSGADRLRLPTAAMAIASTPARHMSSIVREASTCARGRGMRDSLPSP